MSAFPLPRISSAAWAYFRLDLRRRWRPPQLRAALLVLAVIVALQVLITWILDSSVVRSSGLWSYLSSSAEVLHLRNSILTFLQSDLPWSGVPRFLVTAKWVFWAFAFPAVWLMLPAFLATSISGEREKLRLEEVTLTRLTPAEILLAKGLSAAFPALLILGVGLVVDLICLFVVQIPALSTHTLPPAVQDLLAPPEARSVVIGAMLFSTFAWPLLMAAAAAVMVCLSAVSARTRTALILVYGLVLVEGLLATVWGTWIGYRVVPWFWLLSEVGLLIRLTLIIVALLVLMPRAVQAVEAQR